MSLLGNLKKPKKFIKYQSVNAVIAAFLDVPLKEVEEYEMETSWGIFDNKTYVKTIERQGIWGFLDKTGAVHYWKKKNIPMEMVVSFIAHETAHLNNKNHKSQLMEEKRASLIDQIAAYAYLKAKKI